MTLLLEPYDFQAVFLFDPYELCGVEWLARSRRLDRPVSAGMDIPNISVGEVQSACFLPDLACATYARVYRGRAFRKC